jgi:predicted Zn finger-like uncharacterized protein
MKITCPNCQKKYTINEANLSPRVKTAKCKACGQLIALQKAKAPAKASAKSDQIVKITCQYCGQRHRLRQDKIPPATKTINCKSCARPIPLSRASRTTPVHSLKKESSPVAPDKPPAKPMAPLGDRDGLIRFRCAGCGKKYKIGQNKIPPNGMAVKCKACGHNIQLPPKATIKTAADHVQPGEHPDQTRVTKLGLMPEETPPVSRPRKKKWLFAAAACILLVVILGVLVNQNTIKIDWLNQFIPGSAEKTAGPSFISGKEPFLVLNLNVPLILDAFENRLEPDKKTARLQMLESMMKSMDLTQLELYLYAAPNSQVLPVILAHGKNGKQLENVFNNQASVKKYFSRKSSGSYLLKKEAISDVEKYKLPREPYQVTLIDNGAALAPVSFSSAIKKNPLLLTNTPVAKFARTIASRQDLVAIAIRLPETIQPGWEKKVQNHPAVQATPQAAMIAGMGAAIMSQLSASLKPVDILALGFRYSGQQGRALNYAQQFRPGVDGNKIYRQLAAANPADTDSNGIIRSLIELFQDQRYQHTLDFKDNRLALEFSWSQKEDEAFLTALTAATVGQLFAGSMELSPTPGKVETRYATEPDIITAVDSDQLKAKIPRMIKDRLFPGHYWDMSAKPQMTLDLDTIDLPNAALAELTYEVKSIQSPDGKDVLRVEENKFKPRIQPGSLFPGNISLTVKKGTPPDDLATASIDFNLTVPVALEVFDFAAGDRTGSVKKAAGISVTLGRIEKDVARISSSGGKPMRLIAYDQTGKALASKESMSSPSSIATRFEGIIRTLKVVVTRKMLEYPFGIEVDLNQGKELVLSREPEIPARMRFNPHPIPTYVNFKTEDLENLVVKWTEARQGSWRDSLSIRLPQGPFSGHAVWEVHFFGNNKPRFLTGSSVQGSTDFSFTLEKDTLKQAHAAFGKVQLNLHSDISRLVFTPKNNGPPAPQVLPSGDKVSIEFNKNEITYSAGNADVIQTVAYDARGKRLKQDQYTRNKGGNRIIYFWGVPAKFEIDVSTKTIKKLIPFDIKQRPVDEKAYPAFKQTIENQRDVVNTIKTIDQARRKDRSYYGDDLAGLYYLYHSKQKNAQKLISQQVAHSDPAGQERFGYKVRPYKGYYFTVLSGVETNGVNKAYNRRSKKSRFSWQKGTITTTALTRHPDLVAIPEDNSQPTFFLQWGQVFMKPLNGERLKYLPDGYYNKGWVEAKYIDD